MALKEQCAMEEQTAFHALKSIGPIVHRVFSRDSFMRYREMAVGVEESIS